MRTNTVETDTETVNVSTPGLADSGSTTKSLGAAQFFFDTSCLLVAAAHTATFPSAWQSAMHKQLAAIESAHRKLLDDAMTHEVRITSLAEDHESLEKSIRDAPAEKARSLAKVCSQASRYYLTGESSYLVGLSKEDVDYIHGVYNSLLASQTNDPLRMSVMLSASAPTSAAGNFGECLLLSAVCAALGEKSLASHLMPAAFENFSNAAQKYWESEKAAPLALR